MRAFEDYALLIPHLWEKEDQWQAALVDVEGAEKELILCQVRAVNLLKYIPDSKGSPERLAWLSLWAKVFSALEGTRGALGREAEAAIAVLARVAFESALHVHAILEPVHILERLKGSNAAKTTVTDRARDGAWNEVVDRLRAYAAWCLWSDRLYYEELLDPRTLEGVYDPQPTRELVSDPQARAAHEAFFGPLDLRNEHELQADRSNYEREIKSFLGRVKDWLADRRLEPWVRRLTRRAPAESSGSSFFSLLDDSSVGVARRLHSLGLRFSYSRYVRGSMLVHGSTLDQSLYVVADSIAPVLGSLNFDAQAAARDVCGSCNQVVLGLHLAQKKIWPPSDVAGEK